MEAIVNQEPDDIEGSDVHTPNNRRRRPAARSQSARITGGKSVKYNIIHHAQRTHDDNKVFQLNFVFMSDVQKK